ncbi:MAG: hypothetical protein GY886_03030 [Gammaproteobacteria bacterium]|nr:hypothetical protein [Gammaproteobacteria bacterium]
MASRVNAQLPSSERSEEIDVGYHRCGFRLKGNCLEIYWFRTMAEFKGKPVFINKGRGTRYSIERFNGLAAWEETAITHCEDIFEQIRVESKGNNRRRRRLIVNAGLKMTHLTSKSPV